MTVNESAMYVNRRNYYRPNPRSVGRYNMYNRTPRRSGRGRGGGGRGGRCVSSESSLFDRYNYTTCARCGVTDVHNLLVRVKIATHLFLYLYCVSAAKAGVVIYQ